MQKNGSFVISLDFELLWGVFDKVDYRKKETYFQNTRKVIPEILQIFSKHSISCTWATVGMLFNENWEEWTDNIPQELPEYENRSLSSYRFAGKIKDNGAEASCFAPDLIQMIINTPGQELSTHTYSHYYCSEEGQTLAAFKADLDRVMIMSEKFGVQLNSLVFPRNQLNENYLKMCYDMGIKTVRSNPDNWYWKETQNPSILKRLFRTGDAYFGLKDKSYSMHDIRRKPAQPTLQKASRLLRPYSSSRLLNYLKLERIKAEMTAAAKKREVYHLWWHPHNFGNHPEENLKDLKILVQHYSNLREKYGFESQNMADLHAQAVKNEKEI